MSPDLAGPCCFFCVLKVSFHQQSSAQNAEVFKRPGMFFMLLPGIELPLQYQKPQECSCPGSNCPRIPCMLLACEEVNMLESEEARPGIEPGTI